MAAKKQTYEQAMKRLEEIVSRIDSNELDIDSLGVNLKEAQELIKFCRDKLYIDLDQRRIDFHYYHYLSRQALEKCRYIR